MTVAELIPLATKVSIVILVFALGLKTDASDLASLLRGPSLLVRSLLSINLVMPIVAAVIVMLFSLHPPVGVMIFALALSPLPPLLPNKEGKAGGTAAYAISLMVAAALFAIISIPLTVAVAARVFGGSFYVGPADIAKLLIFTLFVPLAAGVAARRFAAGLAERISSPLSRIAGLILLAVGLAILVGAWKGMVAQIGDGTLVALAVFVVMGLLVGHLLGGPDPNDRTVLAISTASRHPAIALALVQMSHPEAKAVLPVLLLYLISNAILGAPYIAWRRKIGVGLPSV